MRKGFWTAPAWAALAVVVSSPAEGEVDAACMRVNRANLVHCARHASLQVLAEQQSIQALEGRRVTAAALFSANPVVSLTGSTHTVSGDRGSAWSASLSQELEIAGQVRTRRAAVEAELDAQHGRVALSEREVAIAAWSAYFEAIAAKEELGLSEKLDTLARGLAATARGRSDKGLIAPVESDIAEAAATRLNQMRLASERRAARASAVLASMIGLDPAGSILVVDGKLEPLPFGNAASASTTAAGRPEVQIAEAEGRALELRAETLRRSRIPNPSVSVFVQNDPFEGRVIGLGLALPLPIPGWGRTYGGEIAETAAAARRAAIGADRTKRGIRLEMVVASQSYESRQREVEAFSAEQIGRADQSLQALAEEVQAGRLALRDAVVAQQALIELLRSHLEARQALCLASVELLRAAGVSLEGGTP